MKSAPQVKQCKQPARFLQPLQQAAFVHRASPFDLWAQSTISADSAAAALEARERDGLPRASDLARSAHKDSSVRILRDELEVDMQNGPEPPLPSHPDVVMLYGPESVPRLPDTLVAAGRWQRVVVGAWRLDAPIHMLEGRVAVDGHSLLLRSKIDASEVRVFFVSSPSRSSIFLDV